MAIRQVQPSYGADLTKSYVLDPTRVEMVIDPEGVPFSLSCTGSLPDNVVEALAEWRYRPGKKNGRDVSFSVILKVPVRRAIDSRIERSLRRTWRPAKELAESLKTGEELDAALDEKPVTLHSDVRPASPAARGREARRDNEYKRRGTATNPASQP